MNTGTRAEEFSVSYNLLIKETWVPRHSNWDTFGKWWNSSAASYIINYLLRSCFCFAFGQYSIIGKEKQTRFNQYMARIWPWHGLRGLHISITWFYLYGIHNTWFPSYGNATNIKHKRHCSGCGVAMGSYGRFIIPEAAIVTSPRKVSSRWCLPDRIA